MICLTPTQTHKSNHCSPNDLHSKHKRLSRSVLFFVSNYLTFDLIELMAKQLLMV